MQKTRLLGSLKQKGFPDKIINAFQKVKREDFIPENLKVHAYEDIALPIGYDQTISQPFTIAFMLNLLDLQQGDKILEIGSGSGYVLALMSEIIKSGEIYGLEIVKELAVKSKTLLANDSNTTIINKSGYHGFLEKAPFNKILISASAPRIPYHLMPQLTNPGILVSSVNQSIYQIIKDSGKIHKKEFPGFAFVPLKTD